LLRQRLDSALKTFSGADEELFEEIEEILVLADVGYENASAICEELRQRIGKKKSDKADEIYDELKNIMVEMLSEGGDRTLKCLSPGDGPDVILVVGVNGTGKTTTIGKLASILKNEGKSVIIAAADTFRAAAEEQLAQWAERSGADIVRHNPGADPGAVVFDTLRAAKNRDSDVVLIDTAGRLHTKINLMEELKKINRVIEREAAGFRKEVLIVLDATSGNNALVQARGFSKAVGTDGIVLTKMDGTAKGGIIIPVIRELKAPVKYIGIGEKVEDLRPFDPKEFTEALL
jgi:fused signal recognition particle receptor